MGRLSGSGLCSRHKNGVLMVVIPARVERPTCGLDHHAMLFPPMRQGRQWLGQQMTEGSVHIRLWAGSSDTPSCGPYRRAPDRVASRSASGVRRPPMRRMMALKRIGPPDRAPTTTIVHLSPPRSRMPPRLGRNNPCRSHRAQSELVSTLHDRSRRRWRVRFSRVNLAQKMGARKNAIKRPFFPSG
jgi:hypothetical protein